MFKSANPALSVFQKDLSYTKSTAMTVQGTVNKTALLLGVLVLAASLVWGGNMASLGMWALVGTIGGLVTGLVTVFKPEWVSATAPIYAVFQGLALGAISTIFERQYPGLVIQAVGLTFATLFCMLGAYKTGIIKVTEKFKFGMMIAMGGLMVFYFLQFILGFFGVHFSAVNGSGIFGIGFSVFVVGLAALNLVMDFDVIEQGANQGAPKFMEWYGAFSLLVTLVWLYVEVLRLLAKLRDRER
jgi:hypothetical protein